MALEEVRTYRIVGVLNLIPTVVSKNKPKTNSIVHKGLHYAVQGRFSQAAYPLELYVALLPELIGFDMVCVHDIAKEIWACVFIGSNKKTVFIPNENFATHIARYKQVNGLNIAVVNEIADYIDIEKVDLIVIEKEPKLVYPAQKAKAVAKIGVIALGALSIYGALIYLHGYIENKAMQEEMKRPIIMNKTADALLKIKRRPEVMPQDDKQAEQILKESKEHSVKVPVITRGSLAWQ